MKRLGDIGKRGSFAANDCLVCRVSCRTTRGGQQRLHCGQRSQRHSAASGRLSQRVVMVRAVKSFVPPQLLLMDIIAHNTMTSLVHEHLCASCPVITLPNAVHIALAARRSRVSSEPGVIRWPGGPAAEHRIPWPRWPGRAEIARMPIVLAEIAG